MAHVRQSRPDSGRAFEVKVLKRFYVVPSSLGSDLWTLEDIMQGLLLLSASERRGSNLKGFKDFNLKAKARIWP